MIIDYKTFKEKNKSSELTTRYDETECKTIEYTKLFYKDFKYNPHPFFVLKERGIDPECLTIEQQLSYYREIKKQEHKNLLMAECHFRDGTVSSFEIIKSANSSLLVYVQQYGVTVTEDGRYLFFQIWEGGLYCFETRTGKQMWRSPIGRVRNILLSGDKLLAERCDVGIEILSVATGEKIGFISCRYDEFTVNRLNNEYFIYGPKKGKYFYVTRLSDLKEVKEIDFAAVNYPWSNIRYITYKHGKIIFECFNGNKYKFPYKLP